jgi:hypothetical protein
MITDDSAGEQAAVKKAFQGLQEGEQDISHLLCIVHSQRTLQRHFAKNPIVLRHMDTALFTRRTKAGCEESINNTIKTYTSKKDVKYLQKEWLKDTTPWAMYARQYSTLLLQIPNTNAIESFHNQLKSGMTNMRRWSLQGIAD